MRQLIRQRPFLASLLINILLFGLFLTIFYTRYGTTDDVEAQLILSGKVLVPEPYGYMRWTHMFLSQCLAQLYTWMPNLPWYGWSLTFAHAVGMTAILYSILVLRPSYFRLAIFTLGFWVGETALLQELQYTSSAVVLGTGAVFLLFLAIQNVEAAWRNWWWIFAALMLWWVSMIRWDAFRLVVVLGTPLLLYGIFQQQQDKIKHLALAASILVLAWSSNQLHFFIQNQDPLWQSFNELKTSLAAHDILDYKRPQYDWTASTVDEYFYRAGWEYEDLLLFQQWFMADSSVYWTPQFKALQTAFQDCPYPEDYLEERAWNFFIEFPIQDYVFYGFIWLAFTLLFLKRNRYLYALLGSMAFLALGILASLYIFKHLPIRVSYPLAFYLISLSMLFITINKTVSRTTKVSSLFILALLGLSNMKTVVRHSSHAAQEKMHWLAALDSLDAQPDELYIGGGDFYLQAIVTPYQSMADTCFMGLNMLDFGHLSISPAHYVQLEHFGIENIHTTAPIDSNIYLVHRYNAPLLPLYMNFVQRHYNMYIEYDLLRKEEEVNIAIYGIHEQIRSAPNSQGISLSNQHEYGILPVPDTIPIDPNKPRSAYKENHEFGFGN